VDEATANDVVERLRAQRIFASVNRRAGVYNVGVRVVIPDGREVIWDNDGAAGLEAMVLRDGVLVGFVPQLPDSDDLDAATIAKIIAGTDYDAPASTQPPAAPPAPPVTPSAPAPRPEVRVAPPRATWWDRLRRGR